MRAAEFRALLHRIPFRPFRVGLASGQHVDVVRPDAAIVAGHLFAVGIRPDRNGIAQGGVFFYNLVDIRRTRFLKAPRVRLGRKPRAPLPARRPPMRADEFRKLIYRTPFEPVRVYITSGETVDIRHPEQVFVLRSMFAFGTGPRKGIITDFGWYSLIHVVKVLPLKEIRRRGRRQSSA
jgi:hypothetical protein